MADFANFSDFNDIDLNSPTGAKAQSSSADFDDFVGGRAAKQTTNTGAFSGKGGGGFGGVSVGGGRGSTGSSKSLQDVDIFNVPTAEVPRFQPPAQTQRPSGSG